MPDPKVSYAPIKRGGTINIDKINVRTPSNIPIHLLTFLTISKFIHALSTYIARDWFLLRGAPVSVVTFGVLGGAGLLLLAWQKSANSHRTLISMKWPKVALYTLIYTAQIYLWFAGLSRLRSTRTLILTQFSDIWNIPFITYLLRNNSSLDSTLTAKGAYYTAWTLILSFFVDLIYVSSTNSKPSIPLSQDMETILDASYFENHTIISLVIGYLSILCSIGLSGYKRTLGKKLAVDVGGNRRLLAISVPLGALMISPLAFVQYLMYSTNYIENIKHVVVAYGGLGAGLIIFDYFVGHSIGIKTSTLSHVTAGWPISIGNSILLGLFLFYEEFSILDIVLAGIMFLGIYHLISADTRYANETHFLSPGVGGSAFELPLHGSANSTFHALRGFGILENISSYIKIILDNRDSRQIFYFLLLNLSYMFVQMVYGIWTNSLGLISDAIHMFFDCLALAVGLFAAIMSKWPENNKFTYGYGRIETLSGFANGVFLILISIFIMFEAIGRLIDPPEMNTDRLLLVSFLGFVVNLSHNHSSDANHGSLHGHHHHHHHHEHGDNANMEGIYLHILADTLGSIGVIISTLLINQFGWTGFDPLASMLIAGLIFMSVVPLVKHSAAVLMLSISDSLEYRITEGLQKLLHVDGIISYTMPRFWPNDSQCLIGSIHIQIKDQFEEQFIISEVTRVLKSHIIGLEELTIQVEKNQGFKGKSY
ncbi:15375_t:CDS:10 [Funneliformis caledonium]|uniref:15375_t:CDS:1 n=1 Tax=Funneliformis caledonium TaxID=1117310 RepID=A0A9N9AVS4_9GLOM|nr:15375_t:CDS:10 [Funneliformis caledonium]